MTDVDHPRVARSISVLHGALRGHVSTAAFLLLLLLYCSPTTASRHITRQLVSKWPAARRGRGLSARMVPPPAAQFLATRRAEETPAGGPSGGGYSQSRSLGLRGSVASPQASAATTAALKAIFTAALLPIPTDEPSACDWEGVSCATNGAAVELIIYGDFSVALPTTPRLCNRTARDPGGKFPATLSESIGQLTGLTKLSLVNLWLAGAVPQALSHLTKLKTLDLSGNCFAGPLPVAFFRLPNLSSLAATENFFSGGLPQGTASYAAMASLAALDLAVNRLSGPIPPTLATLPMLKVLGLNWNRLSGDIPPALLKKVSYLALDHNQLSGDLSGQQIHAVNLDLSGNRLTGSLSTIQFNRFAVLLDVSGNLFSGSFPETLCRSGTLERIDLSRNRLTGTVPANCLSSDKALDGLIMLLSHNNFSGSLQPFTNMPLVALDVGFNKFTGEIPQGLTTSYQLNYLDLQGNALTGPIPAFCQEGQLLSFLNLASNSLSGPPTPLSSPSCSDSLQFLSLPANSLSGPIPATISSFTNLKRLRLDKNSLTGAIPAGVSKMNQLQGLGLSYNRLSGEIPPDWPAGIRQVLLAGNGLSGAVPAALSRLKRGSFKPGNPNLCGKPLPACA